jgi:hypothetical protein
MKDVPTISNKGSLSDRLRDKQVRLDKASKHHRRAATRFYLKNLPSLLQISVPTGPMALAAALHAPPIALGAIGAGAVAILAFGWWAKFKDDESGLKAKP